MVYAPASNGLVARHIFVKLYIFSTVGTAYTAEATAGLAGLRELKIGPIVRRLLAAQVAGRHA